MFLDKLHEEFGAIKSSKTALKNFRAKINGLVFGSFNKCEPEEPEKSFTLQQVLDQHFLGQKFPVYQGATFGHMSPKFTLPIGVLAELDADKFTIRTLEKSVTL